MICASSIHRRTIGPGCPTCTARAGRSGRRGLIALSHQEVQELGLLYRQVAADLSSVREDPMSERLAAYLNQLLGRAHNLIYMGRRTRPGGILGFYRTAFPRVFRETF